MGKPITANSGREKTPLSVGVATASTWCFQAPAQIIRLFSAPDLSNMKASNINSVRNNRLSVAPKIRHIVLVSYVDTKKAGELLGRSGLQLPRVPSLNTDRRKILTEASRASKEPYR